MSKKNFRQTFAPPPLLRFWIRYCPKVHINLEIMFNALYMNTVPFQESLNCITITTQKPAVPTLRSHFLSAIRKSTKAFDIDRAIHGIGSQPRIIVSQIILYKRTLCSNAEEYTIEGYYANMLNYCKSTSQVLLNNNLQCL